MKRAASLFSETLNKNEAICSRLLGQQTTQRAFSRTSLPVTAFGKLQPQDSIHRYILTKYPTAPVTYYPMQSYSQLTPPLYEEEGEPDKLYSLVEVECRGYDPAVMQSYLTFVSTAAGYLNINLQEVVWPQKHIQRWTLLKSVHIYKKHRVQYEVRTHFLIMKFVKLTGSTADTLLEYIQRNLPEGMAMKVTKYKLQKLPEHVKPSSEVVQ